MLQAYTKDETNISTYIWKRTLEILNKDKFFKFLLLSSHQGQFDENKHKIKENVFIASCTV